MNSAKPSPVHDPEAMQPWFGGRIPIVIGTVGHRDLSTTDRAMVKAVRRECRRLRRKYRESPFLLLSGLAEGADRLIAAIALEELGAILVAVLPFPATEFCADFKTATSHEEFSSLLNQAAAIFEVPLPTDGGWKQAGEMRDVQYARVGALIAEQSQILLALWDGRPARGVGGTAEVVGWFERGYAAPEYSLYEGDLSLFDPPQPGLCIRIEPATGEKELRNVPPTRRRFGLSGRANIYDSLRRTNVYNQDVRRQAAYHVERSRIVPPEVLAQVQITEAYAAFSEADVLAIYFARRVRLADWVFYALALAAVFAFSSVDAKPLASWGFLGVMAVMAGVASYVWNCALDTKFLEYRSFAEAMRILLFWRLLGLRRQVWLSYLSKHGTVVRWLRHAVRAVEFAQDRRSPPIGTALSDERLLTIAIDHWLGSQIAYFKRSVAKHSRRYWRGLWVTRAAIALTFATSILLAAMTLTYGDGLHAWHPGALVPHPFGPMPIADFIHQLQVAVGLTAAFGIAARGFLLRRADLELSKQYAAAQEKFEMAERQIQNVPVGDPHRELPPIFESLGREALLEEAEWLWLRHSRPFEAPN
jgi:hypothetical protein